MSVTCFDCGKSFEGEPKSERFFPVYTCAHCQAKIVHPLKPWMSAVLKAAALPSLAGVGFACYTLATKPLNAGDLGRGTRILWISIIIGLCRDHFLRGRLAQVESAADPERRSVIALNCSRWKKSKEYAIMWLIGLLTYGGWFALDHAVAGKIRGLGKAAAGGFKSGDTKAAEKALDGLLALGLGENSPDLIAQRGWARALNGEVEPAMADADAALARKPDLALAFVTKCVASAWGANHEKTLAACADAEARAKELPALLLRVKMEIAAAKFGQGDYAGALAKYTDAIALEPKSFRAYKERALVEVMIGPVEQGAQDLKQAQALEPTFNPGPEAVLLQPGFQPMVEVALGRARDALKTLATLQLARRSAGGAWALTLDELLEGRPDAQSARDQLAASFDGGTALFTTAGDALTISGRAKGVRREVTAQGDARGIGLPELKWENGAFPEEFLKAPPKPKKAARKKRPTR